MLLVACAVSARTALVACSDHEQCYGFYPTDAVGPDVAQTDDGPSPCLGFYPCDAYASCPDGALQSDADADAPDAPDSSDASDAEDGE